MNRELGISLYDDSQWAPMVDSDVCDINTAGQNFIHVQVNILFREPN